MTVPYQFQNQTGNIPLNELDANFTALGSASNSTSTLSYSNAITRITQDKLQDIVSVKDFGAVGDGVTDDTTAIQNALNALTSGGTVIAPSGQYLITSNVTIPVGVNFKGPLGSVGELNSTHNYNSIQGILYLTSSATILMNDFSAINGFYILNSNLIGQLPWANSTVGNAAVLNFAGTAITANGSDVFVSNCLIGGFAQAFYSSSRERTKISWVDIDCTAGIFINASYDIGRVENVHAWPFLNCRVSGMSSVRTGAGYKTTTQADAFMFVNCFAFGYNIGFDIATSNQCTLLNCGSDGGSLGTGQIGFNFTNNAELISMTGCYSSGMSYGVYINTSTSGGDIILNGCQFWGNYFHLVSDQHKNLNIASCFFRDTNGSPYTAITLNSSVTGYTQIANNIFSTPSTTYNIATSVKNLTMIYGNSYSSTTNSEAQSYLANSNNASIVNYNYFGSATGGVSLRGRVARGTPTSPTISFSGDGAGSFGGYAYDGTQYIATGFMRTTVRGTPAVGNLPGSLIFSINKGSSLSLTDTLILNEGGNFYPIIDNASSCGVASGRWSSVWAANGTIQTSDARTKTDIVDASLGLNFINALRPVSYKYKIGGNEVVRQVYRDKDGNEIPEGAPIPNDATPSEIITNPKAGERTHWGLIAQEVKTVAENANVDFGGWILTDKTDPNSEQGLRYDQFISPLIKAIQELSAEVQALKAK